MSTPQFAKLEQANLRDAWAHEAHNFTPWLIENLEGLSEAIGIPLEAEGAEVQVSEFAADILARNPADGTRVLIENQLECSNHQHLGQILTYLAGLQAKIIIWVASEFREAHLSAMNWLNENTHEGISFFAVKVKVVRIGQSPFAPLFDVVIRPNNWEKVVRDANDQSVMRPEWGKRALEFWNAYLARVPEERARGGEAIAKAHRWHELPNLYLVLTRYFTQKPTIGIAVRGNRGVSVETIRELLMPHQTELCKALGVDMGEGDWCFHKQRVGNAHDPQQRGELIEWLAEQSRLYEVTLQSVLKSGN